MRHAGRFALWAMLVLGPAGCATQAYRAAIPDTSGPCHATLADIPPIPLAYTAAGSDAPVAVEFASIAACHRSATSGPTPVALYRLDGITPPAEVQVVATLSPGGTFAARADVLDRELRVLQSHAFDRFTRRGGTYTLTVFLDPAADRPAYLLLSPDPAQVGKHDTVVGSTTNAMVIPAGPVMFTYFDGSEVVVQRPFLAGGKILVTAAPQSTALPQPAD